MLLHFFFYHEYASRNLTRTNFDRHAPRRTRNLPGHPSSQAGHDVQRNITEGHQSCVQEIYGEREFHFYPHEVHELISWSQPLEIFVDDETKLTLHGLQQHYVKLDEAAKNRKLNELLDSLEFNQVRYPISSPPFVAS